MPILHKFLNVPPIPLGINGWDPQFETHNAILDVTPYKPEVLFIGTFNHGWIWNEADFFYGRGMYMWTILANMFLNNQNDFIHRRQPFPPNNNPTLNQIFKICKKGRITFADLIKGTNHNVATIEKPEDKEVVVETLNGNRYWYWKSYNDQRLDELGGLGLLGDNVSEIISYVNNNPSIKHIYFTFKTGNWINFLKHQVCNGIRNGVTFCDIFTPSGQGFGYNLVAPFNRKAWSIAHCWVWNGMANPIFIHKPDYGHLDHNWLINHGVNPNNF